MSQLTVSGDPRVEALLREGIEAHRAGQVEAAERLYREALAVAPEHAPALALLAVVAQDLRQFDAAERLLTRAIALQPDLADAHFFLGNLYRGQRRLEEAARCYQTTVDLAPTYVEAYNNLGYTLARIGRSGDADASFRAALAISPDHAGALTNLGNLLREQNRPEAALPLLSRVTELEPGSAAAQNNLGNTYKDLGRLDEAIEHYRRAIALAPNAAEVHSNLGILLQKLGDPTGAIASFQRAVALRPNSPNTFRNLLSALLFDPTAKPDDVFAAHQRFGRTFARSPREMPWANIRDPQRRLRLGFVSSDFHDHPVARNLMPILDNLERSQFEAHLYSVGPVVDGVTEQFRALADGWRELTNDSDETAADRIRSDGIDILVLLAGRFDRNRPLIATYRAAPVQVSLFDAATSGLESIDYLISDRYMTPRHTGERFVERVLHLPHLYVHPPLVSAPSVGEPPFRRNGYVTFGSCNKPSKLNDVVVDTFAGVLRRVPGSRLLLKYRNQFTSPAVRDRIEAAFSASGVDPTRVLMYGETESFASHLRSYHSMDIALDSFPFNGSTTTFEALWMGVPVVSLASTTLMSRWTGSMLHALALDEFVASSRDEYVDIAASLATRPDDLESLRRSLRHRVASSPLCDGAARAGQIGRLLRAVWRRWCRQAHPSE